MTGEACPAETVPPMTSAKRRTAKKKAPSAIGEFLRATREKQGLSIDDLAFKSHIPARQIGAYERGENVPGEENLTRLLVALNVKVPWLAYSANRDIPGWINQAQQTMPDEPIAVALP